MSDPIYTEKTRELISEIGTNSFDYDDIRVKWEFLKFRIRQFTQSYSKIKAQERRQKTLNLEKKVEILESKISESSDPEVQIQYDNAKNELEDLYDYIKSVQSALSDLLTTSATHGTFSRPSTKRGLILIGLELNTNVRESFQHC